MGNLGKFFLANNSLDISVMFLLKYNAKKKISKETQATICCRIPDTSCSMTKLLSTHAAVKLPSFGYNRYHYCYLAKLSPAKKKINTFNFILPKLEEMITKNELLCFYPAPKYVF